MWDWRKLLTGYFAFCMASVFNTVNRKKSFSIFDLMAIELNDRKVFTLSRVMQSIKETLAARYTSPFWIKAEMNKLNFYPHSGHCYPDLVEKENGRLIAQVRSVLWKDDYNRINQAFQSIVKEPLKDGIKILFHAAITFDATYGLSLRIIDIDPGFSLGDLEHEKAQSIARLREEGIYDRNKLFKLPLLPKRIAIISVDTSKGYADFMRVIEGNEWGYQFIHQLYPALLQGEKAVSSLIGQLQQIKKEYQRYDVVAIIRGGGGDVGLSCYNDYRLSKEVAMFPLPVITGIGHSTNETVVEMLAFENAITPTKLAEFLIQKFHNYSVPVRRAEEKLITLSRKIIRDERLKFQNTTRYFNSATRNMLLRGKTAMLNMHHGLLRQRKLLKDEELKFLNITRYFNSVTRNLLTRGGTIMLTTQNRLLQQARFRLKSQLNDLNNQERTIKNLSPENVLKRGYSITLVNGKALRNANEIEQGDQLQTIVLNGSIISTVDSTSTNTQS